MPSNETQTVSAATKALVRAAKANEKARDNLAQVRSAWVDAVYDASDAGLSVRRIGELAGCSFGYVQLLLQTRKTVTSRTHTTRRS